MLTLEFWHILVVLGVVVLAILKATRLELKTNTSVLFIINSTSNKG